MTVYFTADPHFGHENIIRLCERPFETAEEMNTELLRHWQALRPGDTLYCLGDVAFDQVPTQLALDSLARGVQLHWFWGNHDVRKRKLVTEHKRVAWAGDLKGIKVEDEYMALCHYPMRSWNRSYHGSWQLHGHCHARLEPIGRQLDVGVDNAARLLGAYRPFTFAEVQEILSNKPITDFDGTHLQP
jgi:calcineurin-like phosphoesterase family protein